MVGSNSGTNMRGQIASVDGGSLVTDGMGVVSARVQFPADQHSRRMVLHFKNKGASWP